MKILPFCLTLIYVFCAHLCAQEDSLTHILEDIQDENTSLNSWLEILSEEIVEHEQSSDKKYPKIFLTHRFQCTLEKNEGLANHLFVGSPFESYTRLKLSLYNNISAGVLIQKDVGEMSFADHYSGYASWNHPTLALNIILGNFFIRSGEGLLLSGPFSLPKISLIKVPSLKRYNQTRPFLSSNEYDGFFGGAINVGKSTGWKLTAFYSQIMRDGILSDDRTSVTGFERTGYHRTFTEISRADRILEKTMGATLSSPHFFIDQLGISFVKVSYSPGITSIISLQEKKRTYYNYYGTGLENYSLFYIQNFNTLYASGEVVPIDSKKYAYSITLNFHPSNWYFVTKSWYLPSQFYSPYARIPSESEPFPNSIQGFIFGTTGNPFPSLSLTSFWFFKKDLWRTYFQPLPVQKKEFYLQGEFVIGKKKYLSFRYQNSASHYYQSDPIRKIQKVKHSLRIQLKQSFGSDVRFQSRLEKVFLQYSFFYPSKSGITFYQDFYWQIMKSILLRVRFSSYSTDDYEARLYEYENDLPHVFSNFALYGRGRKWYVMITANPTSHIKFWLKYRRITFDEFDSIGSGLTKIEGDMRQDIHIQIDIRY